MLRTNQTLFGHISSDESIVRYENVLTFTSESMTPIKLSQHKHPCLSRRQAEIWSRTQQRSAPNKHSIHEQRRAGKRRTSRSKLKIRQKRDLIDTTLLSSNVQNCTQGIYILMITFWTIWTNNIVPGLYPQNLCWNLFIVKHRCTLGSNQTHSESPFSFSENISTLTQTWQQSGMSGSAESIHTCAGGRKVNTTHSRSFSPMRHKPRVGNWFELRLDIQCFTDFLLGIL